MPIPEKKRKIAGTNVYIVGGKEGDTNLGKIRLTTSRGVEVTEEVSRSVRATLQKQLEEIIGKVGIDQETEHANEVVIKKGTTIVGKVAVVRVAGGVLNSGVKSADAVIKTSPGAVYWMTVSDTAALAIELNDDVAGAGTDLWALDLPAGGYAHFIFDPPLEFSAGIYLDVSTATCKVSIGYI